ncbi:MAG TPA: sigma-70 family RNA polymerase sigma factor [Gemmatimonadaceae bacterium]
MDDQLDDGALLAAIAAGDDQACRLLVRRHVRAATLLAAQLTGDRDDAEDIVQSAFILAIERAADLDPGRPFAPWLFGVVRRLAMKGRVRSAHRWALRRRWAAEARAAAHAGEARMDAASDLDLVRRHLRAQPTMQRVCFELVVLHDLAVADVAAMHDITESTVRQHVFRARRDLRAALGALLGSRAERWTGGESVG